MSYETWFNWIVAHRRSGEDLLDAAERLIVTYAFVEARCQPQANGSQRVLMSAMLRKPKFVKVNMHRLVRKYGLQDLEL